MPNLSWEMAFPIAVILLGLALAYGFVRYRTRNKANDSVTEAATREEYSHPATYQERQEDFKDRLQ